MYYCYLKLQNQEDVLIREHLSKEKIKRDLTVFAIQARTHIKDLTND